jgi:hypothetical protein
MRLGQEIVIEEHQDIGVRGGLDDRVALARQSGGRPQQQHTGERRRGPRHIGALGGAHDHPIGHARLPADLAQRLAQYVGAPDGRDPNGDPQGVILKA